MPKGDSLSNNRLLTMSRPKPFLRGRCLTNLPGFLQSFATGRTFPLRRERIRRRKPSRNPSRPPRLRLRRALKLSRKAQGDYIEFFSPEQTAISLALSRRTPYPPYTFSFQTLLLPSSLRHTQSRSTVYSRARVLSVSHVVSAKQIDPSSPSSHARDFRTRHNTLRHAGASRRLTDFLVGLWKSRTGQRVSDDEWGATCRRTGEVRELRVSIPIIWSYACLYRSLTIGIGF